MNRRITTAAQGSSLEPQRAMERDAGALPWMCAPESRTPEKVETRGKDCNAPRLAARAVIYRARAGALHRAFNSVWGSSACAQCATAWEAKADRTSSHQRVKTPAVTLRLVRRMPCSGSARAQGGPWVYLSAPRETVRNIFLANAQRSAGHGRNRPARLAEGMKRCASRLAAGRTAVAAGASVATGRTNFWVTQLCRRNAIAGSAVKFEEMGVG